MPVCEGRLVSQLELGDDELAQWMAHLLAERIHVAESAPPEGRVAAQSSCAELVFQLWERRYSFPSRLRPFEKLEPFLRALASLDANNGPRFRFMQEPPADLEVDEDHEDIAFTSRMGVVVLMMLLLSRIEADCLWSQHRKQICDLKKRTAADAQPAAARAV